MDERRHPPGPERDWEESWSFDFVTTRSEGRSGPPSRSEGRSGPGGDGAFGGFVRLALRPAERRAWYWAYLVQPGRPVVVVRDHGVELPRSRELEVRGDGLWAQVICETPFDHWSAGLEASAVAIDDPARAWGDERGDPVALGLDLEWEMQASPQALGDPNGYLQPAAVHGEVLLGVERLGVDGTGWYTHAWGRPGWQDPEWWALKCSLADGTATAADASGRAWTWPPGVAAVAGAATMDTAWGPGGLPLASALAVEATGASGPGVAVTPVAPAPVPLDVGGRRIGVLVRALCRFGSGPERPPERGGGPGAGWGWSEWRQPIR